MDGDSPFFLDIAINIASKDFVPGEGPEPFRVIGDVGEPLEFFLPLPKELEQVALGFEPPIEQDEDFVLFGKVGTRFSLRIPQRRAIASPL